MGCIIILLVAFGISAVCAEDHSRNILGGLLLVAAAVLEAAEHRR